MSPAATPRTGLSSPDAWTPALSLTFRRGAVRGPRPYRCRHRPARLDRGRQIRDEAGILALGEADVADRELESRCSNRRLFVSTSTSFRSTPRLQLRDRRHPLPPRAVLPASTPICLPRSGPRAGRCRHRYGRGPPTTHPPEGQRERRRPSVGAAQARPRGREHHWFWCWASRRSSRIRTWPTRRTHGPHSSSTTRSCRPRSTRRPTSRRPRPRSRRSMQRWRRS